MKNKPITFSSILIKKKLKKDFFCPIMSSAHMCFKFAILYTKQKQVKSQNYWTQNRKSLIKCQNLTIILINYMKNNQKLDWQCLVYFEFIKHYMVKNKLKLFVIWEHYNFNEDIY